MGLLVTGVTVKTRSGLDITSFWIELDISLQEKPNPIAVVELRAYNSEADKDAGFRTLQLYDTGAGLATDVPGFLREVKATLTAGAYATINTNNMHAELVDLLQDGSSDSLWAVQDYAEQTWAGFGAATVAVDLPS